MDYDFENNLSEISNNMRYNKLDGYAILKEGKVSDTFVSQVETNLSACGQMQSFEKISNSFYINSNRGAES